MLHVYTHIYIRIFISMLETHKLSQPRCDVSLVAIPAKLFAQLDDDESRWRSFKKGARLENRQLRWSVSDRDELVGVGTALML